MALTKVPSNLDATIATTQSASDNSTNVATTAYVTTAIANLVDSSPSALNTLNELAAALNDDASFSTTVNNSIATKLPLAGGTLTGSTSITSSSTPLSLDRTGGATAVLELKVGGAIKGYLGASSSNILSVFNSSAAEKVTIDNAGKVGIGASPSAPLTVSGADGTLAVFTNASDADFQFKTASGVALITPSTGTLAFGTSNTARMRIDSSGNVGIGTGATSPSSPLHVSAAKNDGWLAQLINTGTGSDANGLDIHAGVDASDYILRLREQDGTDVMVVKYGGKVGIATTAPRAPLDVRGGHSSTVNEAISFGRTDDNYRYNSIFSRNTSSTNSYLSFKIHDGGSSVAQTETMVLKPGKVGIGETTPLGQLHIKEADSGQGSVNANFDQLVLEHNDHSGMTILSGASSDGGIYFGDSGGNNLGQFKYKHSSNSFTFVTNNGTESFIIDSNGKAKVERTVNGSGSTDYANILEISRIGGATSNAQREAAISFFDSANSTYTAMITGVRTSPAGNYDGGLSIYTNNHSQNGNATSISEMVSGKVAHFAANQSTTFYGDVYVSGANTRISQNGVTREAKGGYVNGNATVSYTVNHTNQSSFKVQAAMNHYGIMSSYGCAHEGIYGNGTGGIYSVLTQSHTSATSGSWSVSRVDTDNITVTKNAGNYSGGGYYYIIVEGANL